MTYKLQKTEFVGCNKMHLNTAMMKNIIQKWLDNQTSIVGNVSNVEFKEDYFEITILKKETIPDCDDPDLPAWLKSQS